MIHVQVLFFGSVRELFGRKDTFVDLPALSRVIYLRQFLLTNFYCLVGAIDTIRFAENKETHL